MTRRRRLPRPGLGSRRIRPGQVRQREGEDLQALAEEQDHEAKTWAHQATQILVTPPCATCGTRSSRIELAAPGTWPATVRASVARRREPGRWYLLFNLRL